MVLSPDWYIFYYASEAIRSDFAVWDVIIWLEYIFYDGIESIHLDFRCMGCYHLAVIHIL